MSYQKPTHTQTPNLLFDEHMKDMSEAELKVCLVAIRKTFGWHKDKDRISLSQFQKLTGLSRQGVIDGIRAAMNRGVLGREESGKSYAYFLVVKEDDQPISQESRPTDSQASRHTKETIKEKKDSTATPYSRAMDTLEGYFSTLRNLPQPDWANGSNSDKKTWQKRWRSPLKRMWEAAGKDTEATKARIRQALIKMDDDRLTVSAPQSVESVYLSLLSNKSPETETAGFIA